MTPEERTRAVFDEFDAWIDNDKTHVLEPSDAKWERLLIDAIRAAEDEALETLARKFDAAVASCEFAECDTCAGYANAAHEARSLKSRSPSSTEGP
jgi:hypothetical protein